MNELSVIDVTNEQPTIEEVGTPYRTLARR